MKITIDLEVLDTDKREWLLDTLNYSQTPFEENREEEWTEEEISQYNKEVRDAVVEYERGEFLTRDEVDNEIESWIKVSITNFFA